MRDSSPRQTVLVIPCSGVGKVHGLISREVVYHVIERLLPHQADTVCLALLVTDDAESKQKVQETACITLDGCPKLCAFKNVELAGGRILQGVRVYDAMKRHRGANFGTPTALSDDGWEVVEELAAAVAEAATSPRPA
jgi:uncharacterized metal-binding protein